MSHINDLIDFTVVAYIVHDQKVLLVDHIALNKWLPVGGHIHLDETPDQALMRKIQEECGLAVTILAEKPNVDAPGTEFLYTPAYMNIHDIDDKHRHVVSEYFVKSDSADATLNTEDHRAIRWFSSEELDNPELKLDEAVKFVALKAIESV